MDISDCRIVHYVADEDHHWPLLVTSVQDESTGELSGHLFTDNGSRIVSDVPYSDELAPHSWHWRERVP